ncbi:type I toxin-antitoxin system Ibs family toxin [Salmonella enterica subsp. enterica]|nr:type I toxin-antitoxin system Ibs family toxin [Salmonella enterica subsp. enterica]
MGGRRYEKPRVCQGSKNIQLSSRKTCINYRLTYNDYISRTLKRESPYRSRGYEGERDMMKILIIVVLLVISWPAY